MFTTEVSYLVTLNLIGEDKSILRINSVKLENKDTEPILTFGNPLTLESSIKEVMMR